MTGTIRDNLTLGKEGMEDARLLEALAAAGLSDLYKDLARGTGRARGGEGGEPLRRAEAALSHRAGALWEAPLLLFDEVTSALDYETKREVYPSRDSA
jgi:ABC-type transport system involved in cytochrome bd biosynthesis fused ATPase/permease subunit